WGGLAVRAGGQFRLSWWGLRLRLTRAPGEQEHDAENDDQNDSRRNDDAPRTETRQCILGRSSRRVLRRFARTNHGLFIEIICHWTNGRAGDSFRRTRRGAHVFTRSG